MQLLGLLKIEAFKRIHADSRGPLDVWQAELEKAQWREPGDIKIQYRNASFEAGNRVIFNIRTPTDRVIIETKHQNSIVLIEWLGTQAEYAKTRPPEGADTPAGEGSLK